MVYQAASDFVGMDMARKCLQVGFTRARRYANHPSGRKYDQTTGQVLPQQATDWNRNEKSESARIFATYYAKAKPDPDYQRAKQ